MTAMPAPLHLEVDGQQVPITNPDKVVFPDIGVTKMDLMRYYVRVADGALRGVADRPMILKRFVKGITEEAVFQKRAPEKRPDFVDVAELKYASGTSAKEAGHPRRRRPGLGGQPRLRRPQSPPGARRRPRPSRRTAGRPRPDARGGLAADRRRGVGRPRCARGLRADGMAEDLRLAGLPYLCAHRTAVAVQAGPTGRADDRARGGTARAGAGDQPVVEGGTRGRLRRLQPERVRPHRGVGLLGARHTRRAGVDAAVVGRGRDCRPEAFTIATVPDRFGDYGDPWEGMDDSAGALDSLLDLADRLGPAGEGAAGRARSKRTRADDSR